MSKPRKGAGTTGRSMDPTKLREEPATPSDTKTQSAPAPGVPVSNNEYERMKERAGRSTPPDVANAQEDCPPQKR